MTETFREREIREPVQLCLPDGQLNPQAVGWSRQPLHRCNLHGRPLRKKRWDYWCVTTDTHVLMLTIADLDYLGLCNAWFLDFEHGRPIQASGAMPLGRGFEQPATVGGHDIHVALGGLTIDIDERSDGTHLSTSFRSRRGAVEAELVVAAPPDHESLSVVVPWGRRTFQYTSKHHARPTTGFVRIGARQYAFGPDNHAFGCLDYGRGVWPWRSVWNWAGGSGVQDGCILGLNLGGKWTDGTGATENGLCIDGRLHKISEDLTWEYDRADWKRPWHIRARSGRVDLTFSPFFHRHDGLELGLIGSQLNACFGYFAGSVVSDAGTAVRVKDLLGWAEEHAARW